MSILLLLKLFYSIYSQTKCYQDRLSHPLYHLLRKLMFYPIFNMLCRSASIPYDFIYAKQLTQVDSNLSMGHLIIVYLFVICTPSIGFFDLLVFYFMKKGSSSGSNSSSGHSTNANANSNTNTNENENEQGSAKNAFKGMLVYYFCNAPLVPNTNINNRNTNGNGNGNGNVNIGKKERRSRVSSVNRKSKGNRFSSQMRTSKAKANHNHESERIDINNLDKHLSNQSKEIVAIDPPKIGLTPLGGLGGVNISYLNDNVIATSYESQSTVFDDYRYSDSDEYNDDDDGGGDGDYDYDVAEEFHRLECMDEEDLDEEYRYTMSAAFDLENENGNKNGNENNVDFKANIELQHLETGANTNTNTVNPLTK
jgi:hypothetical protein